MIAILLATAAALQVIEVSRDLTKIGLHREHALNVTVKFDDPSDRDSSLVFTQNIGKNTYVYLEEMKALKGFEFYPHTPMDIEKPASANEDMLFIWRVPLNVDDKNKPGHVTAVTKLSDEEKQI